MTAVTYDEFVNAFPEFADAAIYTVPQVNLWLEDADKSFDKSILGARYPLAAMLYCAHNITIGASAARNFAGGGVVSASPVGIVQSKSVGQASVSYNTNLTAIKGAGAYNATLYGQRLYTMLRAAARMTYVPGLSQPRIVPGTNA